MLVGDHITSSLRRIYASQQDFERIQTSLERTSDAISKSREAVRNSKALLSLDEPRPQPLAQLSLDEPRPLHSSPRHAVAASRSRSRSSGRVWQARQAAPG